MLTDLVENVLMGALLFASGVVAVAMGFIAFAVFLSF